MRRRLILVFLAISTMVGYAFVIPLAFLVRRTAEDRAIDAARADVAAMIPVLVANGSLDQIVSAVGATDSGRHGRLTVLRSDGWTIGTRLDDEDSLTADALTTGSSAIGAVPGGMEVVGAVTAEQGQFSAVRVFVPDAELHRGQLRAWAALGGVNLILIALSVIVADRMARTVVQPTQQLVMAARRLGRGRLQTKVEIKGPDELEELGAAINELGSRVSSMLDRERELVAELSHRLRTPLTKLRMRLDQAPEGEVTDALRRDVDDLTSVLTALIQEARGALTPVGNACAADEVMAERAVFWSALADEQQRPWTFAASSRRLLVAVPDSELAAALDVLLDNVFAHTPEGAAISLGCEATTGLARLWVSDAGDGFDDTAIERGRSGVGSTGLGLDIARQTAQKGGGTLNVARSRLGGAEVSLRLPLLTG